MSCLKFSDRLGETKWGNGWDISKFEHVDQSWCLRSVGGMDGLLVGVMVWWRETVFGNSDTRACEVHLTKTEGCWAPWLYFSILYTTRKHFLCPECSAPCPSHDKCHTQPTQSKAAAQSLTTYASTFPSATCLALTFIYFIYLFSCLLLDHELG